MFCQNCGKPLAEDPKFCDACGTKPVAESQMIPETGIEPVGVGARFVAMVIDVIVFFILGYLVALLTGNTTPSGYAMEGGPAFLLFILGAAYFILMEGLIGATLGKMALGLTIRNTDGSHSGIREALIRNVLRVIDFLPFFYLLGVILVKTSPHHQRMGDRVAGTVLVRKSSLH